MDANTERRWGKHLKTARYKWHHDLPEFHIPCSVKQSQLLEQKGSRKHRTRVRYCTGNEARGPEIRRERTR